MPIHTNTERQPICASTAASDRDHQQLPDAHAGDRDRIGETGAARKDAHHDHADDHQRGRAVADREHDAVENERMPRLRHQAHQPDADAADDGAADQQRARAQAIGQTARDERRERRHQHVERRPRARARRAPSRTRRPSAGRSARSRSALRRRPRAPESRRRERAQRASSAPQARPAGAADARRRTLPSPCRSHRCGPRSDSRTDRGRAAPWRW